MPPTAAVEDLVLDGLRTITMQDGTGRSGKSPRALANSPSFRQNRHPFIIGVAGGTASGKTTVCDKIMQRLHDQCVVMLSQVRGAGRGGVWAGDPAVRFCGAGWGHLVASSALHAGARLGLLGSGKR